LEERKKSNGETKERLEAEITGLDEQEKYYATRRAELDPQFERYIEDERNLSREL
jgi:hypothetical protein